MHDSPRTRAYWNQSFEGPATGTLLAERAYRPAYTFADGAIPTFAAPPWTTGTVLYELMSGLLSCGPPWEGTGGARGMFGLSHLSIFPSTRVIVWVSVHTSIRYARRTNCCALFLLKTVQLQI